MLKDSSDTALTRQKTSKESHTAHKEPARTLGRPLRAIAITILIYLAVQIVLLIFAVILISVHHNANYSFNDSPPLELLSIALAEALTIYLVFYILKKRRLDLSVIGLGRKPRWSDAGRAVIWFIVCLVLLYIAGLLISTISPDLTSQKQDVGFKTLKTPLDSVLAFIALVILPPLGEEILFRGYLYSALRKYWPFITSLLTTSLIFGAFHLFTGDSGLLWIAGIDTFVLSIILVYLREKTGALYASMLVHMLNNLLAFFVIIK